MRVGPRGVVFTSGFGFHNGAFFPHHHHLHFFFNGCFGSPFCGAFWSPFAAGPIFWPSYDYDAAYAQPTYAAPVYDNTALQVQIQRLTEEVQELRQEQEEARQRPAAQPAPQAERLAPMAVFVLRDGTRIESRNYGIAGQTIWILNERHARMIKASDLDVAATNKLNEERGVDLVIPIQH